MLNPNNAQIAEAVQVRVLERLHLEHGFALADYGTKGTDLRIVIDQITDLIQGRILYDFAVDVFDEEQKYSVDVKKITVPVPGIWNGIKMQLPFLKHLGLKVQYAQYTTETHIVHNHKHYHACHLPLAGNIIERVGRSVAGVDGCAPRRITADTCAACNKPLSSWMMFREKAEDGSGIRGSETYVATCQSCGFQQDITRPV